MDDNDNHSKKMALVIVLAGAVGATIVMNATAFQYEPLPMWIRLGVPLLIFCGIYGNVRDSRIFRVLGWAGITLFILFGLLMIIPGEDYMSGGPDGPPLTAPRLPSYGETALRFGVFISVVAAWLYGFRRLRRMRLNARS